MFFLVPGFLIQSPGGRFLFVGLAALVALVPLLSGSGRRRLIAGVVLAVSVLGVVVTYPEFDREQDSYRERVRLKSGAAAAK